jgi:hypothetical protein
MADTPDTAQQMDETWPFGWRLLGWGPRQPVEGIPRASVQSACRRLRVITEAQPDGRASADIVLVLDQIDTLTARAEKAEAERDALLATLRAHYHAIDQGTDAPSPVEGGQ